MTTALDIIRFVESRTRHPLNDDEGITFGPRTGELTGVTVCFVMNEEAVDAAVRAGHNCIVHHEWLTYFNFYFGTRERHELSWPVNVKRIGMLAKHNLTSMRLHGSIDELFIFDTTAKQLGLTEVVAVDAREVHYGKVFRSPRPTFGDLVEHVKRATGMTGGIRTSIEDPRRPTKIVGMPWGGMGLFVNIAYMQQLIDLGADTMICGETDNLAFRFAVESGIAVIETSHEVSETRGLRAFADALGGELGVPTQFVDAPCIWQIR